MEVLTAFVRERSGRLGDEQRLDEDNGLKPKALPTDVQAAVTVLGRRRWIESEDSPIDLSRSYLLEANLTRAKLSEAHFGLAQLNGARFFGADVREADFGAANLTGVFSTGTAVSTSGCWHARAC